LGLDVGDILGAYRIVAPLGAGGMGKVWRATDERLGRDVALKLLPEALAEDPERVARFGREAKLLASLNHPNIAHVYGFETVPLPGGSTAHLLAMELVAGEDLAERLKRGPLPVHEAIAVAKQIADGVEAAHEKGIVHRDLKPANVKLTPDGEVKVLDFGLAKAWEGPGAASSDLSQSPTLAHTGTAAGLVLGTAAYMSPEQARGRPVDKRADVWAFGVVLFEMLTGRRLFDGETVSDVLAAVLTREPDWQALPADAPGRVRVALKRCLQKDARQRVHDIADVRIELDDAASDVSPGLVPAVPSRAHRLMFLLLSLLGGAAIAGLSWVGARASRETPAPIHLSLTLENQATSSTHLNANRELVISPDGQKVVYVASRGGKHQLLLRALGAAEGRLIDGSEGATTAFFSSDSEWIAFGTGSLLKKVAVSGGSPITICGLSGTGFYGGDWGADDTIVFVPDYNGGLWSVSSSGGTPQPLLKTDIEKDRASFSDPQVLPGGKGVLFTLASGHAVTADDQDVAVLDPGATEPRVLIRGGTHARYLPTGHIVYVHAGTLLLVPFDLSKLAVTGTPVSVVKGLARTWSGDSDYSVSDNGTLVYDPDAGVKPGGLLVMVDRRGEVRPIAARGNYSELSISPDGRSLATRVFAVNDDIWTYDIASGAPLRLTFEPLDEIFPRWTADGKRIAFGTRTGTIFWQSSDGAGQRETLTHGEYPRYPVSFSRDGKSLAFVEIHPSRRRDIWLMRLDGDRQPQPLLTTDADESDAKISPDGQWLAYLSNETGRDELFLRPMGSHGGRKQLSSEGGTAPTWAPNGRELFFVEGDQLAAVTLDGQGNPVGRERVLFRAPTFEDLQFDSENPIYDVMPDGQHFVLLLSPRLSLPKHYDVVLNWFEELKGRNQ
jgi:serine/threonine-protein kinase